MRFYHDKIINFRKRENLSCNKLSRIIGVGRTTLWKWETGKSIPSEGYIRQLAKALKTSVTEISDLKPEQPKSEINYSETINSWLSFLDMDYEIVQQKNINDALQKILSLNDELIKASVIIRALLKGTNSVIYVKDKDLKYMTANDSFLKNASLNLGYKVLNKVDSDFFNEKEARQNHDEDQKVILTGKSIIDVERFIPGTRKKKWGLVSKIPILDSNSKISGIIGSFTDITKLKESEGKRMLLLEAINNIDSYIWIAKYNPKTDKQIKVVFLNNTIIKKYNSLTGKNIEHNNNAEINTAISKDFNPEHYELIEDIIKNHKEKLPWQQELDLQSYLYNQKRVYSEKIINYADNYYFGILEDITEKKKTEKHLKNSNGTKTISKELEIARKLKKNKIKDNIISNATGLPLEEIKKL